MTMHLLPVYYTTTSTRKRKKSKKSKSLLKAEAEHQKFLKKIRGGSSVGRASGLQPEGRGFDPLWLHQHLIRGARSGLVASPPTQRIKKLFLGYRVGAFPKI